MPNSIQIFWEQMNQRDAEGLAQLINRGIRDCPNGAYVSTHCRINKANAANHSDRGWTVVLDVTERGEWTKWEKSIFISDIQERYGAHAQAKFLALLQKFDDADLEDEIRTSEDFGSW